MASLLELQRAMRDAIAGADPAWGAPEMGGILAQSKCKDGAAQPGARACLDIYRHTRTATLSAALALSFPAVRKLVGAEFFEGCSLEFIRHHAPVGAWLDRYGSAFPAFVNGFAPAQSLPWLADVARLEWAVHQALHAHDEAPLDLARLDASQADHAAGLRLVPHPALGLLASAWPVDDIWHAVLDGDDEALRAVDMASDPVHLLVERDGNTVRLTRMEKASFRISQDLLSGMTLERALRDHDPTLAGELLAVHLARGRIARIALADEADQSPMS